MPIFTVRQLRSLIISIFAVCFLSSAAVADSAGVSLGQSVSLAVSVDGTSPFSYQWYKDGGAISGANSASYSIASFSANDVGNYSVLVANSAGSTSSDVATLSVNASLVISTPSASPSSGFSDPSFESVNVGTNFFYAFAYNPVGTAWSFSSSAGVAGNNSGFTSGNPNAPDGTQVAFVQSTGSISQTVYVPAGTYAVSALVANRSWGAQQTVGVYLNGWPIGSFSGGTSYSQATSNYFSLGYGATYTFSFVGTVAGDATLFLDNISLVGASSAASVNVGNSGFENPSVGSSSYGAFQYNPATSSGNQDWSFAGDSGVTGNGSGFSSGNPNAPEGSQVAFIQSTATISQTISFPNSGNYTLSLASAQRGNWNSAPQQANVYLDGNYVGSFLPGSSNYQNFTISLSATQGSHQLSFNGVVGTDSTLFIDRVSITPN